MTPGKKGLWNCSPKERRGTHLSGRLRHVRRNLPKNRLNFPRLLATVPMLRARWYRCLTRTSYLCAVANVCWRCAHPINSKCVGCTCASPCKKCSHCLKNWSQNASICCSLEPCYVFYCVFLCICIIIFVHLFGTSVSLAVLRVCFINTIYLLKIGDGWYDARCPSAMPELASLIY